MKCCESPTTSTAVDTREQTTIARNQMNALLFAQVLKPLTASLGQVGDVAVDAVAQKLFVGDVR